MKILHVETGRHFLGGPQQVIYLINALRERGHDNTLVCPPDSGVDGVARQAGIRVQNLFCAGDLDLPFAYRLSQYLKELAPDIVHCHSRRGADILGGLAASFADIPTVVSRRVDNTEMRLIAALRYRPFKKVIAISSAIAEVLLDRGVEEERLTIIRDAVDVTTFDNGQDCEAFRREFSLADDDFVVAAAGQLIPRKGHRFLLQAVAEIKDRYPKLKLIIFGEGYLNNQLRAQAASLQLGDVVQFAGFRGDLDSFFACFDLFAHPALAEGLGVAALKAAAASVPVVGFSAGGMTESVLHGNTGLLVAPEDADALADAIRQFIEDPDLRRQFGEQGRRRMQNEFSIDTMADKHLALYEAVLNGPILMADHESILALSEALVSALLSSRKTVATAESCTGGWLAKAITDVAGSSDVFAYGIVSYSNGAKESLLGVKATTIDDSGAVSANVVEEMAIGALDLSGADIAVAVSGVAGPGGGSRQKPVGTVWFAWAVREGSAVKTDTQCNNFAGDRDRIRELTVTHALQGVKERIE